MLPSQHWDGGGRRINQFKTSLEFTKSSVRRKKNPGIRVSNLAYGATLTVAP